MSHLIENPFAIDSKRQPTRIWSGLKGLGMVAALFAILVVAQAQSRRWLLDRWVSGISELPVAEQVQRLLQIDALGDIATETVARRLAAAEDPVAATAYELLREHLGEWSIRDDRALGRAHKNMIAGLEAVAPQLTGERARWAKELLNQSLVECADRKVRDIDEAFIAANRVLALLSPPIPNAANPALIAGSGNPPVLPDAIYQSIERPRLMPLNVEPSLQVQSTLDSLAAQDGKQTSAPESVEAVMPIPRVMPVAVEVAAPQESTRVSAAKASAEAQAMVQPVRHLTQSAYEAFDTKSVITLLGNNQADIRDQAVTELVKRGLSNEEIRIANQLASPVVDVRLGLLESIVNRTDLDPRPWLLWLAEDSQREVRLRAITTLATMKDASVRQSLQQRLTHEHDPTVIAHLKRVINGR